MPQEVEGGEKQGCGTGGGDGDAVEKQTRHARRHR